MRVVYMSPTRANSAKERLMVLKCALDRPATGMSSDSFQPPISDYKASCGLGRLLSGLTTP